MQQQQLSHPSGSVLLHLDDGASCPQGIVPSQMPPPPDDELHTRLELTLRDMESAYLLASRWLHTSQATALQMGLHTSFYKRAGVMCAPDLEDPVSSENLLLHLVHMRVSMLSVLEARLHNGDQEVRGKLHMLRRTWKQDKHAVDGYMQHLATSTEQLAKQVQHWREQHDTLCSWAQQAHNSDQNQVPREYAQRAAHMLDSVRGMPEPPFVHSFRAREPFPLCDRNMRQHVQYQRKLYWHQAPAQYLLEHTKTHGEHVLVDFRKTMQVFQEHHCMLAEEGWVPQHDLDSLGPLERMRQFVSQNTRSAKQEAMQAQEQAKQARKRKPATYAERVAEQQQHESQRQHSNRLHEALEHAYKPADLQRRNMLLRRRIETPDGYSVLRALVHRVRWAQHQMKQEQETIEALERQLKQLVQPSLPPECHVDDTPLPTGDYDPARDDDGRAAYEQRMYRAVEHLLREAQKRQPSSAQEEQLREQLRQSLDTLHHWKRFLYSHLGLCDVILCLEDPSDAVLMRQDEAMQEPSLLHQHYPYDELGLGEELLRSVQSFVMPVELVYGSDHAGWPAQDPRHDWHAMLKKVFPKACSDRDFAVKNDEICRKNAVYCDFVIESLQASLMGMYVFTLSRHHLTCFFFFFFASYKHCRNPAPFDVAIMLHRCFSLARHWKPAQEVMLEVFVTHEELVINAIRENIAWQFRHDQYVTSVVGLSLY